MKSDKQHIRDCPAHVFTKFGVQRARTLSLQGQGGFAEALTGGKEHSSKKRQTLQRIIAAVVCPMTIRPLVVARNEDEGCIELVEQIEPVVEHRIAAQRTAV